MGKIDAILTEVMAAAISKAMMEDYFAPMPARVTEIRS